MLIDRAVLCLSSAPSKLTVEVLCTIPFSIDIKVAVLTVYFSLTGSGQCLCDVRFTLEANRLNTADIDE